MTRNQKYAVAALALLLSAGAFSLAAAAALLGGSGQQTVLVLLVVALVLCSSAVIPLAFLALRLALPPYANGGLLSSGQVRRPVMGINVQSVGQKPLIRETKLPRSPRQ